MRISIFTDGACRGNGSEAAEAAIGVQIVDSSDKVLNRHCERIGHATNNQAEYRALIRGLELATKYTSGQVDCYSDSQLVVNQMNEKWKIRDSKLRSLWTRAAGMESEFETVTYSYLPRADSRIAAADALANKALDEH